MKVLTSYDLKHIGIVWLLLTWNSCLTAFVIATTVGDMPRWQLVGARLHAQEKRTLELAQTTQKLSEQDLTTMRLIGSMVEAMRSMQQVVAAKK